MSVKGYLDGLTEVRRSTSTVDGAIPWAGVLWEWKKKKKQTVWAKHITPQSLLHRCGYVVTSFLNLRHYDFLATMDYILELWAK